MPRVIVNSTSLILLAGLDKLSLFAKLYGKVVIPRAVFNEVTAKADSASYALNARPDWAIVEQAPAMPGRGFISEVGPLVEQLRKNGFRVDDRIVSYALELAHER